MVPYDQAYEQGFEDMPRRVPDCSKLEGLVGFRPNMDIPEIVEAVVRYYRER
jgi:UDP-glucose 4-epimerase